MSYQYGKPFFIIAGTIREAMDWYDTNFINEVREHKWSDFHIVKDHMTIMGCIDINGIFVGTWKQRPDIKEIVSQLLVVQRSKTIPQEVLDFYHN